MTEREKWHEIFMADCEEGLKEIVTEKDMLRLYRGCSLRDMAKRLDISPAYLSEIEHGKKSLTLKLFRKMEAMGYSGKFLSQFEIITVKRKVADK